MTARRRLVARSRKVANPGKFAVSDERFILGEVKSLLKRSGGQMLKGGHRVDLGSARDPEWWTLSTERIGSSVYVVARHGREERMILLGLEGPWAKRVANPAKKARTYAVARKEILAALAERGWDVRASLKTPWATHPRGDYRVWLHAQAIYFTMGSGLKDHGAALSTWVGDTRKMTPEAVVAWLEDSRRSSLGGPQRNPARAVCRACGRPSRAQPLRYTVRGISGRKFTGRVVTRGNILCRKCAPFFQSA